ncbi:disintegrin and metalloproteinase domain-containing protein 5-like isoform X2 [Erinaceus europaeus]|nr:disintegrin and metalloproteinase domain-containing protein 5-like isoform X2 [Erinaceus europaeus]
MDCNYNGYISGFPNSLVSLNICSGLRGVIQLRNISYGIEPMEAVSGFTHIIYEEKSDHTDFHLLGKNVTYYDGNIEYKSRANTERIGLSSLFLRHLEVYIVVDKNLFDYMNSDIKAVTQKVVQIIGLANAMFIQFKMNIIISSIEIWSNENKISTTGNANHILMRFLQWKQKHVFLSHHIAYLFIFKESPDFLGTTYAGNICNENLNAGVILYSTGLSLESYTVGFVQLLGISLGITYGKNDSTCFCSGDVCTMSPEALYSGGAKDFSTCNLDEFKYIGSHGGFRCLYKQAADAKKPSKKICGNGIIEGYEECDCGTSDNCTHKACCDPTSCRLKGKHSVCGSGECCGKQCKYKPIGTLCRKAADPECDFPEYCNGKSSLCVPDTYAQNGYHCNSGDSYCYGGKCRTFAKQCTQLLGQDSRGAPFICFDEINTRADRYGNCGNSFCTFSNVLCGKLVCTWPFKKLIARANLSVIYTHIREDTCVSTYRTKDVPITDVSTTVKKPEDRDDTYVEDGTPCGPDMYCVNFSCKEIRHQPHMGKCDPIIDCQEHGICNNFNHCHCDKGFAPPSCDKNETGFGSIDDGHLTPTGRNSLSKYATMPNHQYQLIFYISLPVLLIIAVVSISKNKLKQLCNKKEAENERSEDSSNTSTSKLSHSASHSLEQS